MARSSASTVALPLVYSVACAPTAGDRIRLTPVTTAGCSFSWCITCWVPGAELKYTSMLMQVGCACCRTRTSPAHRGAYRPRDHHAVDRVLGRVWPCTAFRSCSRWFSTALTLE